MSTTPHTLYRMHDAAGRLLYVGISMTIAVRFKSHRLNKPYVAAWKGRQPKPDHDASPNGNVS